MNALEAVGDCFYMGTAAHAMNSERINRERDNTPATVGNLARRFQAGVLFGAKSFLPRLVYGIAISAVFTTLGVASKNPSFPYKIVSLQGFMNIVVIAPLVEEILFRVILQNVIHIAQEFVCQPLQGNRIIDALGSSEARILSTNAVFAAAHLANAEYTGKHSAYTQSTLILLTPGQSITYETHGFAGSLGEHMSNNALSFLLMVIAHVASKGLKSGSLT